MKRLIVLLLLVAGMATGSFAQTLFDIANQNLFQEYHSKIKYDRFVQTKYGNLKMHFRSTYKHRIYKMIVTVPRFTKIDDSIQINKDFQYQRVGTAFTNYIFKVPKDAVNLNYFVCDNYTEMMKIYKELKLFSNDYIYIIETHKFITKKTKYGIALKSFYINKKGYVYDSINHHFNKNILYN